MPDIGISIQPPEIVSDILVCFGASVAESQRSIFLGTLSIDKPGLSNLVLAGIQSSLTPILYVYNKIKEVFTDAQKLLDFLRNLNFAHIIDEIIKKIIEYITLNLKFPDIAKYARDNISRALGDVPEIEALQMPEFVQTITDIAKSILKDGKDVVRAVEDAIANAATVAQQYIGQAQKAVAGYIAWFTFYVKLIIGIIMIPILAIKKALEVLQKIIAGAIAEATKAVNEGIAYVFKAVSDEVALIMQEVVVKLQLSGAGLSNEEKKTIKMILCMIGAFQLILQELPTSPDDIASQMKDIINFKLPGVPALTF